MAKKDKKKVEQIEENVKAEGTESKAPATEAEASAKVLTLDEELEKLKRELAKAKSEVVRAKGEKIVKADPPAEPKSLSITTSHMLNEASGFVEVDTVIGHILYRSFPKDDNKGIARTIVYVAGEQIHKYNNIGIANVVASEAENFADPSELEAISYHALKSRREGLKLIDMELFQNGIVIRAERKAAEGETREKIKQEKVAKKAEHIAALEARIAELEAQK